MAGTPPEDLLQWLEREEQILGFTAVDDALYDLAEAQKLFYDELGYDLTEAQFSALGEASALRYEYFPEAGVSYTRTFREDYQGWQDLYRYAPTGQFINIEQAMGLVSVIR